MKNGEFVCLGCKHKLHTGVCGLQVSTGAEICQCKRNNDERLIEISEEEARYRQKEGHTVLAHSFDPLEIEYFDKNGFQAWCTEGYRFEAVRYFMIQKSTR